MLKARSSDSLHTELIQEETMLTSTKICLTEGKVSDKEDRRKNIIPTPHRPKSKNDVIIIDNNDDKSHDQQTFDFENNGNRTDDKTRIYTGEYGTTQSISNDIHVSADVINEDYVENRNVSKRNCPYGSRDDTDKPVQMKKGYVARKETKSFNNTNIKNKVDENLEGYSYEEEEKDDDSFDRFILENFIPFTGKQNVLQWLSETETKFNRFRIIRSQRYIAIPLLVEDEARFQYMKNKKEIHSFDDFYEFLISQYPVVSNLKLEFN